MDASLKCIMETDRNVGGVVNLEGYGWLSDKELRQVASEGIRLGYKTLMEVPDGVELDIVKKMHNGKQG